MLVFSLRNHSQGTHVTKAKFVKQVKCRSMNFEVQPLPGKVAAGVLRGGAAGIEYAALHEPLPEDGPGLPTRPASGGSQGHGGKTEMQVRPCPGLGDSVCLPIQVHSSSAPAGTLPPSVFPPEAICCSPGHLGWFSLRPKICLQSLPPAPGGHSGSSALGCPPPSEECLLSNKFSRQSLRRQGWGGRPSSLGAEVTPAGKLP